MRISLMKLQLDNFKGTKHLIIETKGKDVNIKGDNKTGKTTVADAFYWLLFNTDSKGRSKFNLKTLDVNSQEIHNLHHSVYAVLDIDGKETHIRKTFKEIWTRKRGAANKTFTGHETIYELGDSEETLTPKKMTEFNSYITSIIDEKIFKLVTNPFTFSNLKTEERKNILMSIVGDIEDDTVIKSNPEIKELLTILGDGSIEDLKARVKREKKSVNEEMTAIPIRIDEVTKSMPDVQRYDEKQLVNELTELAIEISDAEDHIENIKNSDDIKELNNQLSSKRYAIDLIIKNHDTTSQQKVESKKLQAENLELEYQRLVKSKEYKQAEYNNLESKKVDIKSKFNQLGEEGKKLSSSNHDISIDTVCECCGQEIPKDMQQEAMNKRLEEYNVKKAQRLEDILNQRADLKSEAQELLIEQNAISEAIADIQLDIENVIEHSSVAQEDLAIAQANVTDVKQTSEYKQLEKEISEIGIKINELDVSKKERINKVIEEMTPLLEKQSDLSHKLNEIKISKHSKERIEELEAEQKKYADRYEELENIVFMTEEFTKTKVKLLEDSINEQFKRAKFKLFEVQVDGGIKDVCEAMYEGVPFSNGLNTADQINIGLDIINTLSDKYNFYAPIMIDNAESVTQLEKTEAQQISLTVSAEDKKLKVEVL